MCVFSFPVLPRVKAGNFTRFLKFYTVEIEIIIIN